MATLSTIAARFAVGLIRIYQYAISPSLGYHCRFYPSCSNYAHDAIQQLGIAKGTLLALKRLLRCHPWHPSGIDLVPNCEIKNE